MSLTRICCADSMANGMSLVTALAIIGSRLHKDKQGLSQATVLDLGYAVL